MTMRMRACVVTHTFMSFNSEVVHNEADYIAFEDHPPACSCDHNYLTTQSSKIKGGNPGSFNEKLKCESRSKRNRTVFTADQLQCLEREFKKQQYMVGTERYYLAKKLNLNEAQVRREHIRFQFHICVYLCGILICGNEGDSRVAQLSLTFSFCKLKLFRIENVFGKATRQSFHDGFWLSF